VGSTSPDIHYKQNVSATYNLLETARKAGNVKTIIFTSSSTIYGEDSKIPTPEDYAPLKPISIYGASKLASEALISAYAYTYGFKATIYRLANIVGPRNKHGVIHDFIQKLRKNPKQILPTHKRLHRSHVVRIREILCKSSRRSAHYTPSMILIGPISLAPSPSYTSHAPVLSSPISHPP